MIDNSFAKHFNFFASPIIFGKLCYHGNELYIVLYIPTSTVDPIQTGPIRRLRQHVGD